MNLGRYIARKTVWYLVALVAAVGLNFLLPRLVPGNPPVDVIVSNLARGSNATGEQQRQIYEASSPSSGWTGPPCGSSSSPTWARSSPETSAPPSPTTRPP